jgi:hypothetical protein
MAEMAQVAAWIRASPSYSVGVIVVSFSKPPLIATGPAA